MKKTKFNPELLKEELNRFKLLETYDFYHEDKSAPEYEKPLLLGNIEEEDEEIDKDVDIDVDADVSGNPEGDADAEAAGDDIANDLGVGGDEPVGDMPEPEAEEVPIEEPAPAEDEIEIDVTSLVKSTDDAKMAAEQAAQTANQNSEAILHQLADLEARLARMSVMNDKIDNLEHEIIKRNPTPVEKLEMRSFDSYPYNQKLTDYWADKEGPYNVMNTEPKKKEYVLSKQDVDHNYSEPEVKKSFDVLNNDEYEEEDI